MWDKVLADIASKYPSGVLTTVEASGYPASVRCSPSFDEAHEVIRFSDPSSISAGWRGKACILFHHHNEHLEGLRQLVIKGELVEENGEQVLMVTEFVTANGRSDTDEMPHAGAPLRMMQFLFLVRSRARDYMAKRGSPWPPIPFDEIGRLVSAPDHQD